MSFTKFQKIKNFRNNKKDFTIFILVTLFALHGFYFIHSFAVNTIVGDEFNFLPFVKSFVNGDEFWTEDYFLQYDLHRLIIPNFIILFSVFLSKWNTIYLMYFGWILVSLSVMFIFLMITKTHPKENWLIIPIAAILFSPIHYGTFLWSLPNNSYLLLLFGFVGTIYFLDKIQDTRLYILPAILFSTVAMFSSFTGMIIWAVGVLSLLDFKKFGKFPLLIWILSAAILTTVYFVDYTWQTIDEPVTTKSSEYTINFFETSSIFFSKGFVNNIPFLKPLETIIGLSVLVTLFFGPIFLKFKKIPFVQILPWIQFGIIGLIISLGLYMMINFSDNYVTINASVYSLFATFPQIGCIVILTTILIHYKNTTENKKLKTFSILLLIMLFSCLSVGLFGSYVVGWWHGFQLFDERIQYQNCILNEESVSLCLEPGVYDDYIEKNKPILDELKLGPLADGLKYNDHSNDPLQAFLHTNIVGKPLMINLVDYSQKKSDGTIWNDPHNVILNYNTSLQIDLQQEFFENEIQLGLDSNDTYSIQFYNGEQFLGREILYTDNNSENIKNYNLQVSEKISKNGYDTIKIQPLSGDNRFSFSHIILE